MTDDSVESTGDAPRAAQQRSRNSARTRQFRLTAAGLVVVGVLAAGGAAFAPSSELQEILVAVAGVGLLGGVLTVAIRPGATADVDPAQRMYDAHAANASGLLADLDAGGRRVYAPIPDAQEHLAPIGVLCLQDDAPVPPIEERQPVVNPAAAAVPGESPTVVLYPTGAGLLAGYEEIAIGELPRDPLDLADHLSSGAVAGLDLAASIDPVVDAGAGSATFTVTRPRFGPLPAFDHPVASFLAAGLATGLDRPVTVSTSATGDDEYRITCEWAPNRESNDGGA